MGFSYLSLYILKRCCPAQISLIWYQFMKPTPCTTSSCLIYCTSFPFNAHFWSINTLPFPEMATVCSETNTDLPYQLNRTSCYTNTGLPRNSLALFQSNFFPTKRYLTPKVKVHSSKRKSTACSNVFHCSGAQSNRCLFLHKLLMAVIPFKVKLRSRIRKKMFQWLICF